MFASTLTTSGVNIRPHNGKPKTVVIFNNTLVTKGEAIRVTGAEPGHPQFIVGNAVFGGGVHGPGLANNVTGSYESAAQYLANPFGGPGELTAVRPPAQCAGSEKR